MIKGRGKTSAHMRETDYRPEQMSQTWAPADKRCATQQPLPTEEHQGGKEGFTRTGFCERFIEDFDVTALSEIFASSAGCALDGQVRGAQKRQSTWRPMFKDPAK